MSFDFTQSSGLVLIISITLLNGLKRLEIHQKDSLMFTCVTRNNITTSSIVSAFLKFCQFYAFMRVISAIKTVHLYIKKHKDLLQIATPASLFFMHKDNTIIEFWLVD